MKARYYLFLCCMALFYSSCRTPKDITYFENIQNQTDGELPTNNASYEVEIEPSDELLIIVNGKEPRAVAQYNLPGNPTGIGNESSANSNIYMQTYVVDPKGYIQFPQIGNLYVAGKTTSQLRQELEEIISKNVKEPLVTINLINFKVAVMGEVLNPGMLDVKTEKITILDAISMAGDITITGMRTNVLLLREENNTKQFHRIDLTKTDLFSSPYYYLKQNDVIYVAPNKARKNSSKIDPSKQYNLSIASTITSVISVIASLCIALIIK